MSAMQKFAWFNLAVLGLAAVVVLALLPFLGHRALGGFGFLGLLGLSPLCFLKKPGQVLFDERDQLIWQRAWFLAYSVFWAVFVFAAAVLSALFYGEDGDVPVWVVRCSVFCGLVLVLVLASLAILGQYAGGRRDVK